jgi:beta-lactamase class A
MVEGRTAAGATGGQALDPVVSRPVMAPVAMPALDAGEAAGVAAASSGAVNSAVQAVDAVQKANPSTELGAAVLDRKTGELALGAEGTTQFYSASVVKLYTVVAILHRVETGAVTLTAADRNYIQRALVASDDNAMDELWEKFGGAQTVAQTISLVGLKDSKPPADPSQWGETRISARDVTAVYNYVLRSMAPSSRDMIMNPLGHAQDKGADGFDQAFGLIAPPRQPNVAAKQGWMWIGSDFDLHTTGVLGADDRYVVVVLSKNPARSGSGAARTIVNKAASAAEAALPEPR